jgi:nitrogen fixation protein FixH
MRRSRRAERGASAVKMIISLALLALVVHTGYVAIPIYVAVYDFNSQVETEAQYGAQKTNEAIAKALVAYGAERKLPIKLENIKVARTASRLTVAANYTVPVKMLFYTYNWQVSTEHSAVLF